MLFPVGSRVRFRNMGAVYFGLVIAEENRWLRKVLVDGGMELNLAVWEMTEER